MRFVLRIFVVVGALFTLATSARAQDTREGEEQPSVELEARVVTIEMFLIDLYAIDGANQSFHADLFVQLKWNDPSLAGSTRIAEYRSINDVWHPLLLLVNRRDIKLGFPERVSVEPNGDVTYLQRATGHFTSRMDLRSFPTDSQVFNVHFVVAGDDNIKVDLKIGDSPESEFGNRAEELSISDWEVGKSTAVLKEYKPAKGGRSFPGVELRIPARRLTEYYVIQVLLPVIAIVMMAWAVFWVDPTVVPTRVGTVVTTMLTVIAYRFILVAKLPSLTYLTRIDFFMLGTLVLIIAALFTMAGAAYLNAQGRKEAVRKIDIAGRILYPIVFMVLVLVSWT